MKVKDLVGLNRILNRADERQQPAMLSNPVVAPAVQSVGVAASTVRLPCGCDSADGHALYCIAEMTPLQLATMHLPPISLE